MLWTCVWPCACELWTLFYQLKIELVVKSFVLHLLCYVVSICYDFDAKIQLKCCLNFVLILWNDVVVPLQWRGWGCNELMTKIWIFLSVASSIYHVNNIVYQGQVQCTCAKVVGIPRTARCRRLTLHYQRQPILLPHYATQKLVSAWIRDWQNKVGMAEKKPRRIV
jgi:hypothetical protein